MINFRIPIRGVYDSVTRPISIGILNDIKEILYVNSDIRSKLANQIDDYITNEQWNPVKLEQNSPKMEDIKFSVEEETNTETLITTSSNYNEYKAILHDTDVNAFIRPIYVDTNLKFNIKYRTKSKTNANNFINMLKLSVAENETLTLHNIEYMFYIPPELLELFLDIGRLKENILQEGVGYEDYLIKYSDGRLTAVGGLDGKLRNFNIVAKEKQRDVVGFFDSSVIDARAEYNSSEDYWESDITYNISYNKPIALFVSYPPLIFNQLLPKKYLVIKDLRNTANDQTMNKTYTGLIHEPFNDTIRLEASMSKLVNSTTFVNIPNFDTYVPSRPQPWMMPCFSILVSIEPADLKTLFNLAMLPEYDINPTFMKYIQEREWEYITKKYQSIFYIEILENDNLMADNTLTIDKDLNVSSTIDLDLKKTYRVIFNIVTDLSVVSRSCINRLNQYTDVYNLALNALSIRNTSLNRVLSTDEKVILYNAPNKHKIPYTVMIGTILAYKLRRR